jgi:hypothetical protein
MGNIMNLTAVRNKPSRNGFDLSQKINFTSLSSKIEATR